MTAPIMPGAEPESIDGGPHGALVLHGFTGNCNSMRGIAQSGTQDGVVHLPHAEFQPMAADDVASAVADAAIGAPAKAVVEVAGPEPYFLDELVGRVLAYDKDSRKVVADPDAPYFEVHVSNGSLMPGSGAKLAATGFDWWLTHVPPPPPRK